MIDCVVVLIVIMNFQVLLFIVIGEGIYFFFNVFKLVLDDLKYFGQKLLVVIVFFFDGVMNVGCFFFEVVKEVGCQYVLVYIIVYGIVGGYVVEGGQCQFVFVNYYELVVIVKVFGGEKFFVEFLGQLLDVYKFIV